MEEMEISAKTVEDAISEAEQRLGVSRDNLEVVVVTQGRGGVFGIGGKESVIRVKPLVPPEKDVETVAREVLETLLRLMGIEGKIEALSSNDIPVVLNIEGDDLGILIGRRGNTLASLEYIVRLMVVGRLKAWLPLSIDVAQYRKRRRDSLSSSALHLAEQVKTRHRAITLEPMPPNERRIIHLALANHPDVVTHSVGEGEGRKVVILPRRG
jgi:spoIIIJ-associated protein